MLFLLKDTKEKVKMGLTAAVQIQPRGAPEPLLETS